VGAQDAPGTQLPGLKATRRAIAGGGVEERTGSGEIKSRRKPAEQEKTEKTPPKGHWVGVGSGEGNALKIPGGGSVRKSSSNSILRSQGLCPGEKNPEQPCVVQQMKEKNS